MSTIAIWLVLVSAVLHALKSFFIKKAKDKFVFISIYNNIACFIFLPFLLYFVGTTNFDWEAFLFWGVFSSICHFAYFFCFAKSMESGDLSLVYPIIRSSPALVLICAILFLGEEVSLRGALGISIVVVGIYIINFTKISLSEFLDPFKNLLTVPSLRWSLLTMITVTGYSIVDKQGAVTNHPMIFACAIPIFTSSLFTPYVMSIKNRSLFREEWRENKRDILINSVICVGGYVLIIIAFSFEKLSYVAGLRQVSVVIAVILGGSLLKEENFKIRIIASSLIFLGAYLIATA